MDEPGLHARIRAERQYQAGLQRPHAYEDVVPLEENDIDDNAVKAAIKIPEPEDQLTGYKDVPGYRPPPQVADHLIPGATHSGTSGLQGSYGEPAPPAGSEAAQKHYRMDPHLQLMCGPMLRYDTCVDGIYHAFCMIVTADTGSDYSKTPDITYRYTPSSSLAGQFQQSVSLNGNGVAANGNGHTAQGQEVVQRIEGQKIWIFHSLAGGNSFWRFKIEIKQGETEMPVSYKINNGRELTFFVPGREENFRWVGHSCNGFSAGVDTEKFNGPDPLWNDVLRKHSEKPIHALVGGGDQIYCDAMVFEPAIKPWLEEQDEDKKRDAPLTDDMRFALDRFYFNHYCKWFRNGAFGRAISTIPMLNMLDDHDLIDGFGSYPDELQKSPVFSHIGSRGIFFYQLFQLFIVDEYDGTTEKIVHCNKSLIRGGLGPWVPFNNHSFLAWLGPNVRMLLLDCRTERKKTQVVSRETYDKVFAAMRALPSQVTHLILLLGVPIAYPRMVFAETILASNLNPLILLGKSGVGGLGGLVNKFNHDAELLDDLNDHWTAKTHKEERNWLVLELQKLAVSNRLRVSILSGDVHLAAIGSFYTHKKKLDPAHDPKYMVNVISSAIVNTPPPPAVIGLQGKLNKKTHKTLHHSDTDETMIPLFETDTDGKKLNNPCFMGRRNYCLNSVIQETGEFEFDMRVEIAQGIGETKGYPLRVPQPAW